jgi:alkylation response protein AidB-like acyl-CoA dehydrogenase
MDLAYSPEQLAFVESFGAFCEKEVASHAAEVDQTASFPRKSFEALAKFGYLGLPIPEAYGGQSEASDPILRCLAQEIVAKSCPASFFVCGASNGLFAAPIVLFGSDEQKKRFLPGIANGTKIGAMALTEPHAGSDAASIRTRAVKKGDRWLLTGTKTFITNAPVADYVLIHAVSDPKAGPLGVTSFIAEKGTPGLEVGPPMKKMGMKGSPTAELFLQDCEVPDANVLGGPGQGFLLAMQTLEWGRVGIANFCVGIGQACLEDSIDYATTRQAFGRPIATFGDVRSMIARMALSIETARRMAQRVAWTKEKVGPCPAEASAAKLYASETGMRSAHAAVQIHGGMGYIAETRVERLFRDIRIAEIGEGTSEIQRHILAKDVFER